MVSLDRKKLGSTGLGLFLACLSFAPAPPVAAASKEADLLKKLAEARFQSSLKAYDESWAFYRQARTDPYFTYSWSRMVMLAQFELSDKKADRIASVQGHLDRMKKLELLVARVRQVGFQRKMDILGADYFVREAELWLAETKLAKNPAVPPSNPFPFPTGG